MAADKMVADELVFERSGFRVIAIHLGDGLRFETIGTVGLSGEDLDAFMTAINAWYTTPRLVTK